MINDIGAANVPFNVDYSVVLTEKNIEDWKEVPWTYFSKDERPEEIREKITSIGRMRFLEGWLYDNQNEYGAFHKEWYWAKMFKNWFHVMKKKEFLKDTKECEGCTGSFWEFASEDDLFNALPGYWILDGRWWRVLDSDRCNMSGAPPSMCQIDQVRYNRRLTIQMKAWEETDADVLPAGITPENVCEILGSAEDY